MARKDTAAIVSGAGWIGDFVGKLVDGLLAKGHTPEEIHSLVTAKQRPAMEKIVDEVSSFLRGIGNLLRINRSQLFNPSQFLGEGWSIWLGPANGDGLSGGEDQDERSLRLTELDLSNVQLVACLKDSESVIKGEEKLMRLKAKNHIRLDAKIFQTLWENQESIPESWKEKTNGNTTFIFFDGTVLRSSNGVRCVLFLYWNDSLWRWVCSWLEDDWFVSDPSAVLAN